MTTTATMMSVAVTARSIIVPMTTSPRNAAGCCAMTTMIRRFSCNRLSPTLMACSPRQRPRPHQLLRRSFATGNSTTGDLHRTAAVATAASESFGRGEDRAGARWATAIGGFAAAATIAMGFSVGEGPPSPTDLLLNRRVEAESARSPSNRDLDDEEEEDEDLPVYTLADVAKRNGKDGAPIWMTYGGRVYDVTSFVPNHPGGAEYILMAAGTSVEPYWNLYRQHFASDLPMRIMETMVVGELDETEQEMIDERMGDEMEADPYGREPPRSPALHVHSDQPANMEVPRELLTASYVTPNELFYIRHHQPVPYLTPQEVKDYRVKVDLTALGRGVREFSLDDLRSMPKRTVLSTLQCSGNRRGEFNRVSRTSGTTWHQGAVSTAVWGGVLLHDVLEAAGLDDEDAAVRRGLEHVRFEGLDGMKSSIPLMKASSKYGDCLLAYEMNGETVPRDHGFPVRLIVPGYIGVRSVKWIDRIELAAEETDSVYVRGLTYKLLPPSVMELEEAKNIDLTKIPATHEASVYSGITRIEQLVADKNDRGLKKSPATVRAYGWAWAGGGRSVARIDVSGDGGATWKSANITEGQDQKYGRAWAWVFWSCELPVKIQSDGTAEVCSKAVDCAYNVQPEKCDHIWNVRGLNNNSWFRSSFKVQ